MTEIDPKSEFAQDVFAFLDDLRESGDTNMYGAGRYLEEAFGFDSTTARRFLTSWMQNFGKDKDK